MLLVERLVLKDCTKTVAEARPDVERSRLCDRPRAVALKVG